MDWRTESDNEEFNEKPYSALSTEDPDRFLSRSKYPRILLGIGVVLLIVLAIVFFSRNPEQSNESRPGVTDGSGITGRLERLETKMNEITGIQQQVDQLESRILGIEENLQFINNAQMSQKPESADQVQASAKAAEVLEAAVRRLDLIENRVGEMEKEMTAYAAKSDQPASGQTSQKTTVHVVKKGDTLYSIARKYNLKLSQLLRANGMDNKAVIYPGQELKIPN